MSKRLAFEITLACALTTFFLLLLFIWICWEKFHIRNKKSLNRLYISLLFCSIEGIFALKCPSNNLDIALIWRVFSILSSPQAEIILPKSRNNFSNSFKSFWFNVWSVCKYLPNQNAHLFQSGPQKKKKTIEDWPWVWISNSWVILRRQWLRKFAYGSSQFTNIFSLFFFGRKKKTHFCTVLFNPADMPWRAENHLSRLMLTEIAWFQMLFEGLQMIV